MQTLRSPRKLNDQYSPSRLSPNRSQGNSNGCHFNRKQSVKKGLFQIEIEKQNKENRPTLNLICSTSSSQTKPEINMLTKVVKGLSPHSSRLALTPTKNFSTNCGSRSPSINKFAQDEKLTFKKIYSTDAEDKVHKRLDKSPGSCRLRNPEYQIIIPVTKSALHT
jgi:hypothetical protein